ncbi:TIM barrel protein [Candidatus Woesearchaeota archaeon]|nr:TIM barrel protein [Candidatus Woesearchaeota archaeon]
MKSLLFGTPGIPISTKPRDTFNGIKQVKALGLDAMELEFVQNVNVNETLAPQIKKLISEQGTVLTCHGQYFVNLAAIEPAKYHASIGRMVAAAKRLYECGGYSATWHMGFYLGRPKQEVHPLIAKGVKEVVRVLQDQGVKLWIRPETTGKETQWGDLKETIKLAQDVEMVLPCVDFGHLHARYNGKNNSSEEFRDILAQVETGLGREALDNMHIQVCGIAYGPKGEKHHLNLEDSDLNWRELLATWKEFKVKGVAITESPNIEGDALLLKQEWEKL